MNSGFFMTTTGSDLVECRANSYGFLEASDPANLEWIVAVRQAYLMDCVHVLMSCQRFPECVHHVQTLVQNRCLSMATTTVGGSQK